MNKVSIIVSLCEAEKYLRTCLESVVNQDMEGVEVICVYDESKDGTRDILEEYSQKYSWIKVIYNLKKEGLSRSRNIGIDNATGKYIQFLDADDYLERGMLQMLYETAQSKRTDIVYFNKKIIYEDEIEENPNEKIRDVKSYKNVCSGKELFVRHMNAKCMKSVNAYTQFFRREFLNEHHLRFRNGIIYEDIHFYFFCAFYAKRVFDLNLPLYVYRRHENCGSLKETELHEKSMFIVFSEIWAYWQINTFSERENNAIELYIGACYHRWRRHFNSMGQFHNLKEGTRAENWLYRWFTEIGRCDFSADEIEKIRCANRVYIYGAGFWGQEIYRFLMAKKFRFDSYVVTGKTSEIQVDDKVLFLDSLNAPSDSLFIIAADKSKEIIKKMLKDKGYYNCLYGVK